MTPSTSAPVTSRESLTGSPSAGAARHPSWLPSSRRRSRSANPLRPRVPTWSAGRIRIKSDNGGFEVKVPRELAGRPARADNVRVDLTFQR